MADTNKLVSMIALVISGLLIAAWGAIYIWLYRKDQLVIADLQRNGKITAVDTARLTNPTWVWILAIVQIVIGIGLIIWGLFQYFAKVDDVAYAVKKQFFNSNGNPTVTTTATAVRNANVPSPFNDSAGSRRVFLSNGDATLL
jgi:hypothetical protein